MTDDPKWYREAESYIGLKEIHGSQHAPLILKMWTAIRAPFTNDETPWCAAFVGACLEWAGIRSTRSPRARSYETWGVPMKEGAIGAVLVFSRGKGAGHVGFYAGEDTGAYHVLGGNQGDAVNISRLPKSRLVAIRWPLMEPFPTSGKKVVVGKKLPTSKDEA